jgi:DNA uptake protein ComE-like DNA-binding protein
MGGLRQAVWVSLLLAVGAAPGTAETARLLDVNRASAAELMTLPGIRDAWARAIVRNRPYSNKAQILSRKVIPRAAYLKIKDLIVAKQ